MNWLLGSALAVFLSLSGCSAGFFDSLAKDLASACGYSTVTYGGFAVSPAPVMPGMGVYVHQRFCRSNTPGSVVELRPDGTMAVQHGVEKPKNPELPKPKIP